MKNDWICVRRDASENDLVSIICTSEVYFHFPSYSHNQIAKTKFIAHFKVTEIKDKSTFTDKRVYLISVWKNASIIISISVFFFFIKEASLQMKCKSDKRRTRSTGLHPLHSSAGM